MTTPARYLLDTNLLSDLIRNPLGRIAAVGAAAVLTSIVVAGELRFSAAKRRSPALKFARVPGLIVEDWLQS